MSKMLKAIQKSSSRIVSFIGIRRFSSSTPIKPAAGSTICDDEITKFSNDAEEFWGAKYQLLHAMNSLRVPLIRDGILSVEQVTVMNSKPLTGYKIIDVGCGSGLLAEPLARLGASVTGLDPGLRNIEVAIAHAAKDEEIKGNLNYVCDTVENASVSMKGSFDAVVCSEVLEHVANVPFFTTSCVELAKDGASLFFTTVNRTLISYIGGIVMAEYVLNLVPKGTHEWNKFVKPEDLQKVLEGANCRTISLDGMLFNLITQSWTWSSNKGISYAIHAVKES